MKLKIRGKRILIILIIFIGLLVFFRWQNNSITINEVIIQSNKIEEELDGYKILQISDLHNKEFGSGQRDILKKIEKINPDIIVVTGDLIDSSKTNVEVAMDLIKGASEIASIFYVSGNHEAGSGVYEDLRIKLEEAGVYVLEDEKIDIIKGGSTIDLIGLSDPNFLEPDALKYNKHSEIESKLKKVIGDNNNFKILLSHRPELFDIYSSSEVDLVFSGHAHGGQFRLPFIGGIIAPDQGLFPKLTEGIHKKDNTTMIISRGLGNSIIPIRIFNRPEIIVVTLSK